MAPERPAYEAKGSGEVTYSPKELARCGVPEPRCRLRAYRRSIRRTAADVAALAGCSAQTVLVWERGARVENERAILWAYEQLKPVKDYGAELRAFRALKGVTQGQVAELAGIDRRTLSQVERRGHSIAPTEGLRERLDAVLPVRVLSAWSTPALVGRQLFKDRRATRKRRAEAKEFGLCLDCRNPAVPGRSRCEKHAEAHRVNKQRWRAAKRKPTCVTTDLQPAPRLL